MPLSEEYVAKTIREVQELFEIPDNVGTDTLFVCADEKSLFCAGYSCSILFIPMFLTPNGTTGVYNLTLFLLPYRAAMPEFGKYILYRFGSLVLDALTVRAVSYVFLTVVMLPLAGMGFKKHQVA